MAEKQVTVNGVTYHNDGMQPSLWTYTDIDGETWTAEDYMNDMLDHIAELELSYDADHKVNMANIADFKADNTRLREALREIEPLAKWYDDNYPRMGSMWDGGDRARAILSLARTALQGDSDGD